MQCQDIKIRFPPYGRHTLPFFNLYFVLYEQQSSFKSLSSHVGAISMHFAFATILLAPYGFVESSIVHVGKFYVGSFQHFRGWYTFAPIIVAHFNYDILYHDNFGQFNFPGPVTHATFEPITSYLRN